MSRLLDQPIFLLITTGTLLGLNFPLGMLAAKAGISPLFWAFIISLGACAILLPKLLLHQDLRLPKGRALRYMILSSVISYIIPNFLLFVVMLQLGAGYMGIMFALSPVFTLGFAVLFSLKVPNRLGIFGVGFGLLGAIIISLTKGATLDSQGLIWIFVALCVPLSLAIGNIYRTLDWPDGQTPDSLAFWGHLFAACIFLMTFTLLSENTALQEARHYPMVVLLQLVVSGLTFPLFFRLQKIAGPVMLSQIGYVAAAVSLLCASTFLGETYPLPTWLGAATIALGISLSIKAQTIKELKA